VENRIEIHLRLSVKYGFRYADFHKADYESINFCAHPLYMIPFEFKKGFLKCEIYLDIAVGRTSYREHCFQTEGRILHTLDCVIF